MKKIIFLGSLGLISYLYLSNSNISFKEPTSIMNIFDKQSKIIKGNNNRIVSNENNLTIIDIINLYRETDKVEYDSKLTDLSYEALLFDNSNNINKDLKYVGNIDWIEFKMNNLSDLYSQLDLSDVKKIINKKENVSLGYSVKELPNNTVKVVICLSDVYPWVNKENI